MTVRISPMLAAREACERSKRLRMEAIIARSNAACELAETRMASARLLERSKALLRRKETDQ